MTCPHCREPPKPSLTFDRPTPSTRRPPRVSVKRLYQFTAIDEAIRADFETNPANGSGMT